MTSNLDLYELRNTLKSRHESQGVSKGIAMKLMQELEESRARGRKEWGRANKAEDALKRVRELREGQLCGHCADTVQEALEGEST